MNIFIGRLSNSTTNKDIYLLFKPYGFIIDSFIVKDKISQRSRGYGYVIMRDKEDALKAIEELNGYLLNEEELIVKPARPGEIQYIYDGKR